VVFGPSRAQLVLIPGVEAAQALAEHVPAGIDAGSAAERDLLRDCANGETQRARASKGFLWSLAAQGWRVLLHPLAVSIKEELQKYAQVSEASASGDYYQANDAPGAATAPLSSRISCVRFTRFLGSDSATEEVALDFVASVRLDTPRDAIRVRPLRLFISHAGAKSTNGHYSVAVSVKADAVWRDEFAGHQAVVFEQTVATESIDLKAGSYLKYYTDTDSGMRVPIVPVSFATDRSHDFGRAEFGVAVAELGTAPATLTLLGEMLPVPEEKFSKLLIDAACAGAGLK